MKKPDRLLLFFTIDEQILKFEIANFIKFSQLTVIQKEKECALAYFFIKVITKTKKIRYYISHGKT